MSEQAYDAPKCPFQDMPEPPPKYEESRSDTGDEINKNRGAGLTAQDICNQQQAPVMLVHNGQVVRVGQGTTLLAGAVFGKRTMPYTCPSCMQTIMTQTKHKAGKLTYLLACLMCCFVCKFRGNTAFFQIILSFFFLHKLTSSNLVVFFSSSACMDSMLRKILPRRGSYLPGM